MPRSLDDIAKETLGKNLREMRDKRAWTQAEAARRAGVRRDRLARWEIGRETPGTEGLLRLAIAYACPIDQLLSGVDERYDELIEARLPQDAHQHYRVKAEAFIRRTTAAMQLALDAPTLGPMRATNAETPERARGKSGGARAHRKRGK
jgi:transcriptional regulator with XRE-family HTH domain